MPHPRKFLGVFLLFSVIFSAVYSSPVFAGAPAIHPARISPGVSARLEQQLLQNGFVNVIVGLQGNFLPEGQLAGSSAVQTQRAKILDAQTRLLEAVKLHRLPRFKSFKYIPYLALTVDAEGLDLLEKSPFVTSIEEDVLFDPALAESVSLIGATSAHTAGYAGQGQAIAILDTGVDKTHPFLAGKVVSEACYSSNYAPYSSATVCPGGVEETTAVGSGVNCSVGADCDHGTHVAGIAAGKGTGAIPFSGVAPQANLISIQVFSRFSTAAMCPYGAPCVRSYQSDQLLALERVYALRASYNIAAVNMSLGGGTYASYCDASFGDLKAAIDNLRSVGIATVIASGNDGSSSGISGPACISSAVSVGSTLDGSLGATPADAVSTFSNSASYLSLLAPGQYIYSSIPGGQFATYQGTSMAAPHTAGAWAVLKSKDPSATVDEVLSALTGTGIPVLDTRNGITKPRLQVDAALNALPELIINSVHFGSSSYSVPEEGGHVDLVVNLDAPAQVPFTVDYATDGETAVAGNDFLPATGTLSFDVGETSHSFSVDILEDGADESSETFRVELSNPSNNLIINTSGTTQVTILDNDDPPSVQFAAGSASAGEADPSVTVTVQLSAASGRTVTVHYSTVPGTATPGDDFSGGEGTLQFDPGETTKNFTVTLEDDLLDEPDEVIQLVLSAPSNAALGESDTVGLTIADNDPEPTIELIGTAVSTNEGAGTVSLTVALSAPSGKTITVHYSIIPGSASAGSDYENVTGDLVFDPGETQQVVVIHVVDDDIDEPDETFTLHLGSPGNAGLGATDQVAITIQADQQEPFSVYLPIVAKHLQQEN